MAFERRLVDGTRCNRATDGFNAATALAQQMVHRVLRAARGCHDDRVGRDRTCARGLVNVDDLDLGPVDFLYSVVGDHFNVFFFKDTATTEIYTLSLHDALPISEALAKSPITPRLSRSARGSCRNSTCS